MNYNNYYICIKYRILLGLVLRIIRMRCTKLFSIWSRIMVIHLNDDELNIKGSMRLRVVGLILQWCALFSLYRENFFFSRLLSFTIIIARCLVKENNKKTEHKTYYCYVYFMTKDHNIMYIFFYTLDETNISVR